MRPPYPRPRLGPSWREPLGTEKGPGDSLSLVLGALILNAFALGAYHRGWLMIMFVVSLKRSSDLYPSQGASGHFLGRGAGPPADQTDPFLGFRVDIWHLGTNRKCPVLGKKTLLLFARHPVLGGGSQPPGQPHLSNRQIRNFMACRRRSQDVRPLLEWQRRVHEVKQTFTPVFT